MNGYINGHHNQSPTMHVCTVGDCIVISPFKALKSIIHHVMRSRKRYTCALNTHRVSAVLASILIFRYNIATEIASQ